MRTKSPVFRKAEKSRPSGIIHGRSRTKGTNEIYVQGMSSSLPEEVQKKMYATVPGMENVRFMRTAYAIEYDCIDPTQLSLSLQSKHIGGLFMAGQINGTSGYEEAAAQGLIAGINAVQYIRQEQPLILGRADGYSGVLIDDLVTKGTKEPYRMMTPRAEYRLLLRQDNADMRLTQRGREIGLVTDKRYDRFMAKKKSVEKLIGQLHTQNAQPKKINGYLQKIGEQPLRAAIKYRELLKRPRVKLDKLMQMDDQIGARRFSPEKRRPVAITTCFPCCVARRTAFLVRGVRVWSLVISVSSRSTAISLYATRIPRFSMVECA